MNTFKLLVQILLSNIIRTLVTGVFVYFMILSIGLIAPFEFMNINFVIATILLAILCELMDINHNIGMVTLLAKMEFNKHNPNINDVVQRIMKTTIDDNGSK